MKHDRTIIFTANTSWYLFNFRFSLAKRLAQQGYSVLCVAPRDEFSDKLAAAGFRFCEWPVKRSGMNPMAEVFSFWRLFRIYSRERPILAHHFTIKAVLYGSLAAKILRIKGVVNSVTGLGHVFIDSSLLMMVVRIVLTAVYRSITDSFRTRFIFQNQDDIIFFTENKMVTPERARLVRGSGVDVSRFFPREPGKEPTVLFVGRLLREKGVHDFLAAAKLVKQKNPQVRFFVAGDPDFGNPSSISREEMQSMQKAGIAEFHGHVESMEEMIGEAHVVALPSYREGLPRSLLEAGAMEKGLIASDVPGCREVVIPGDTGILVPKKNPEILAEAMMKLLNDDELRRRLGRGAREYIEKNLSDEVILKKTEEVYRELLASQA